MDNLNLTIQQKVQAAGECYVIEDLAAVGNLVDHIQCWGIERNITAAGGASALSQIKKLRKEIDELQIGLMRGHNQEILDGIGDCLVVLAQITRLANVTWDECLAQSWNDIKDRKGEMHHGIFVKQDDLDRMAKYSYPVSDADNADEVHKLIDDAMTASVTDQATL